MLLAPRGHGKEAPPGVTSKQSITNRAAPSCDPSSNKMTCDSPLLHDITIRCSNGRDLTSWDLKIPLNLVYVGTPPMEKITDFT